MPFSATQTGNGNWSAGGNLGMSGTYSYSATNFVRTLNSVSFTLSVTSTVRNANGWAPSSANLKVEMTSGGFTQTGPINDSGTWRTTSFDASFNNSYPNVATFNSIGFSYSATSINGGSAKFVITPTNYSSDDTNYKKTITIELPEFDTTITYNEAPIFYEYDATALASSSQIIKTWSESTDYTGKYKITFSLLYKKEYKGTTRPKARLDYEITAGGSIVDGVVTGGTTITLNDDNNGVATTCGSENGTSFQNYKTAVFDNLEFRATSLILVRKLSWQPNSRTETLSNTIANSTPVEYSLPPDRSKPTISVDDMNGNNFRYGTYSLILPCISGLTSIKYELTRTGGSSTTFNIEISNPDGSGGYKEVWLPSNVPVALSQEYQFQINHIVIGYSWFGKSTSDTLYNTRVPKKQVIWPRTTMNYSVLSTNGSFSCKDKVLSFSFSDDMYSIVSGNDRVIFRIYKNSETNPIVDTGIITISKGWKYTHTLAGDMPEGTTNFTAKVYYYIDGGANAVTEIASDGTVTANVPTYDTSYSRSFSPEPEESFLIGLVWDTSSSKWKIRASNPTGTGHDSRIIKIQVTSYYSYMPYYAGGGLISSRDYQGVLTSDKITIPKGTSNGLFDVTYQTNNEYFPRNIHKMAYNVIYMDADGNKEQYQESGFYKYTEPSAPNNAVITTFPLDSVQKAMIGGSPDMSETLKSFNAGSMYYLRFMGTVQISIPFVFTGDPSQVTSINGLIQSKIGNNLKIILYEYGTSSNLNKMFSFNSGTETSCVVKLDTFVNSPYLNGLYITNLFYDNNTTILTLTGNYSHLYKDAPELNDDLGRITAKLDAVDIPKIIHFPVKIGNNSEADILIENISFNPNFSLSRPWARPSGNVIVDYSPNSPIFHVQWENPAYPSKEGTEYGSVDETGILIKRERLVDGVWVKDDKFKTDIDGEWKLLPPNVGRTKNSATYFDEVIFSLDAIEPTGTFGAELQQFDNVNPTIYRTYRYQIAGYNATATDKENKIGPVLITNSVRAETKTYPVDIIKTFTHVNEINQVITVAWTPGNVDKRESTPLEQRRYPADHYTLCMQREGEEDLKILKDNIKQTYFDHKATPGVKYIYYAYAVGMRNGSGSYTSLSSFLPKDKENRSFNIPFTFSEGAVTSIVSVANRTFYLSDMDRAVVVCNNRIYKAGIKRPKFGFNVTTSQYGNKTLQTGLYEAYVVLVRKDTGTRSGPSNPQIFTVSTGQNTITVAVPLDTNNRVIVRDEAYTSYGKKVIAADLWEVYVKCLDNDSFGQPVCIGSAPITTGSLVVSGLDDETLLSVSNRRLPSTEPYTIAPCCSVGEYYNNRLYLTGERSSFTCKHFVIATGDHTATIGEHVPEGIVGKQIFVNGTDSGWSVSDIDYVDNTTVIDIAHFDLSVDSTGWDSTPIIDGYGDVITFQSSSAKVYYSAYFFGEPDGVTYTFCPETFPPLNVLESELSSNDFSSPIALVKSRDSLFVGKKDKMIAITGGNTDDNTYIANTTINILSNTLGVLGRRTIASDDQDNVYCLSDHGLVIINTSGVNLVNYVGNTKSSFRLMFDLSDIKNSCAVWSPRDQYYIVFGLRFKGNCTNNAGLIYDNYTQQVRPFELPVEVTSAMVCRAKNGEYQIVIADSDGCIGVFLDKSLAHDLVFDWSNGTYGKRSIHGNITTGVYKPTYGITIGPYIYPGFRPSLPEIEGANSSLLVKPQNVTVGFDLLGRTNYFNQFNPEVENSVNFTIPMNSKYRRVGVGKHTGNAICVRVDFDTMKNHIEFGSISIDVNEETY